MGYVFDLDRTPAGLARQLEHDGYAVIAARTADGVYAEPARSLAAVMSAIERSGAQVRSLRRGGDSQSWQRTARPVQLSRQRLRYVLSAFWLPTLRVPGLGARVPSSEFRVA
jgi:hypothetical protein